MSELSVRNALQNPFDFQVGFCPLIGWTLALIESEISLCITRAEALLVIEVGEVAMRAESHPAPEATTLSSEAVYHATVKMEHKTMFLKSMPEITAQAKEGL